LIVYLTYNHPQAKYVRTAGGASDLIDKLSDALLTILLNEGFMAFQY